MEKEKGRGSLFPSRKKISPPFSEDQIRPEYIWWTSTVCSILLTLMLFFWNGNATFEAGCTAFPASGTHRPKCAQTPTTGHLEHQGTRTSTRTLTDQALGNQFTSLTFGNMASKVLV